MKYETVIGLEVHVELATNAKIFCTCSAHSFGAEPNTHVCPACCGMPGTLPTVNKRVVDYAIKAGLMLGCSINRVTSFDRKSYFYPDLPSAYQITQAFSPIALNGLVEIVTANGRKGIRIKQIHMEEDAGKLIHDISENTTHIDYNRTSVPLIEIVTEPDLSTPEEVEAYLERIKTLLRYARVAECEMAHGTMRCDVNLSVRPAGSDTFGTRTELKNMNSVEAIKRAITYESQRHVEALENGTEVLRQETRRWDETLEKTVAMRTKETTGDYRYAPEPNLMPIVIDDAWLENVRRTLPDFPEVKRERYLSEYALGEYDAEQLSRSIALCECFERAVAICHSPKNAANWILSEVMGILNAKRIPCEQLTLDGGVLGKLILLVSDGKVGRANAKIILAQMLDDATIDPEGYANEHGFLISNDTKKISSVVRAVIASDPKSVADYLCGKEKALMALFGKCMKELRGNCDPQLLRAVLLEEISRL